MTEAKHIKLSSGTLNLRVTATHPNWTSDALLDFAERLNPMRAFLFVSKVLGRHIPVAPSTIRHAFTDLTALVGDNLPAPMLVLGMAETATGLGAGVHSCLSTRYPKALFATTTRHNAHAPIAVQFLEEHSHAKQQQLYAPTDTDTARGFFASRTLVVVDDELSTGKTVVNLVNALTQSGFNKLSHLVVLSLADWTPDDWLAPLIAQGLHCQCISLLKGRWQWRQVGDNAQPSTQPSTSTALPCHTHLSWGQIPSYEPPKPFDTSALISSLQKAKATKILVLGVGEYVWSPFLLAEQLQQQFILVHFGALTRSPIKTGLAIKHKLTFADPYGTDTPYFLYNVKADEYDAILICGDGINALDPILYQALPNAQVIYLYPPKEGNFNDNANEFC